MELEQIKKILARYNEGQSTPEEQQVIEQWFENIDHHQPTSVTEQELKSDLTLIQQTLQNRLQMPAGASTPKGVSTSGVGFTPDVVQTPGAEQTPNGTEVPDKVQTSTGRYMRPWYAVAAAIALLVAAGAWLFQSRTGKTMPADAGTQPLADAVVKTSRIISGGFMIITTAKGDTIHTTLEDGSTVQLNAGSRLRYPLSFGNGQRDLYLEEGEAYFEVAPHPGHSFAVHAGRLTTTALGTTFNIRAYTREQKITVALLSGKVKVENDSAATPLLLSPSEQASYDLRSLQLVKTVFRANNPVSWQEGNLVFNDASYEEVRTEIENRFGVTLINQSDKQTWTYTGNFRQESLRNVIETICLTESLSYVIGKDTVLLKNKGDQ